MIFLQFYGLKIYFHLPIDIEICKQKHIFIWNIVHKDYVLKQRELRRQMEMAIYLFPSQKTELYTPFLQPLRILNSFHGICLTSQN